MSRWRSSSPCNAIHGHRSARSRNRVPDTRTFLVLPGRGSPWVLIGHCGCATGNGVAAYSKAVKVEATGVVVLRVGRERRLSVTRIIIVIMII